MSKKKIWLIVGLMSTALAGILGLQLYAVYSSYKLNLELFENNVHAALDHVVSKLEQYEIEQTAERYKLPTLTVETDSGKEISTVVEVEAIHSSLKKDSIGRNFSTVNITPPYKDSLSKKVFASEVTRTWKKGSSEAFMTHFKTYFTHHTIVQNIPIEERVSLKLIDKLLHRELTQKGINATYAYGVYSLKKDTFVLTNQLQQNNIDRYRIPKSFKYQAALFPSSQEQLAMLFIDFPHKDVFIWQ